MAKNCHPFCLDLGVVLDGLVPSWAFFGCFWGGLWAVLAGLAEVFDGLGVVLRGLGAVLSRLERSWRS